MEVVVSELLGGKPSEVIEVLEQVATTLSEGPGVRRFGVDRVYLREGGAEGDDGNKKVEKAMARWLASEAACCRYAKVVGLYTSDMGDYVNEVEELLLTVLKGHKKFKQKCAARRTARVAPPGRRDQVVFIALGF